ncbi:RecJ like exonuclease, partial [Halobacteriales archaeon QH_10_70_21]
RLDVENHARRFTYPAPGKTTGELHDRKVQETGDPVITIGYGPDFAVLRSDGVRLDIPNMVTELQAEIEGAGVSGGGHLVVGSIKFVSGMREPVVDALVEKMADAELDEALRSTLVRDDD